MRQPGIEPGSIAWKATMLTFTPPTLWIFETSRNLSHVKRNLSPGSSTNPNPSSVAITLKVQSPLRSCIESFILFFQRRIRWPFLTIACDVIRYCKEWLSAFLFSLLFYFMFGFWRLNASAGNRTRIYCLEGNNANLYTTDAVAKGTLKRGCMIGKQDEMNMHFFQHIFFY